jgi:hypothetical protein
MICEKNFLEFELSSQNQLIFFFQDLELCVNVNLVSTIE